MTSMSPIDLTLAGITISLDKGAIRFLRAVFGWVALSVGPFSMISEVIAGNSMMTPLTSGITAWCIAVLPLAIFCSVVIHELIHAAALRWLLGFKTAQIGFDKKGGFTRVPDELYHSPLWRRQVLNLAPGILLGIVFPLLAVPPAMDFYRMELGGWATGLQHAAAMLVAFVALNNLLNLIPFKDLDGSQAWQEFRDRRLPLDCDCCDDSIEAITTAGRVQS